LVPEKIDEREEPLNRKLILSAIGLAFSAIPFCSACTVCSGGGPGAVDNASLTQGVTFLVAVLLGTTGLVFGGLVAFIFHLRKMAKLAALNEEQGSSVHAQHTPLWHLQHAHAASGAPMETDFGFFNPNRKHRRNFFKGDQGSRT
jgi:hypothetical protein